MVKLLYIDLSTLAADVLLEGEGERLTHYHVSRADWRVDTYEGTLHTGSFEAPYDLARLDQSATPVPVLVKWIIRGLHGLPVEWEKAL